MRDETDCSVVETALRECEEEIQLQRDVVKVTSVLPSLKLVLLLLLILLTTSYRLQSSWFKIEQRRGKTSKKKAVN